MSVKLAYQGEVEYNNSKGIMLKATFVGNYGVNTVGDLLNLLPSQNGGLDGGITDPKGTYNNILSDVPPTEYGILNEDLGGSYVALHPNAAPSLTNLGLIMYEPGGAEKATAAAYTAPELAGSVLLIFFIRAEQ
jgi:hypothetical protein